MRGKTAKRLRNLAKKSGETESTKYLCTDGSIIWKGLIRIYRDLKKEWKRKKWDLNKGEFIK